jgi:hypothetical protein
MGPSGHGVGRTPADPGRGVEQGHQSSDTIEGEGLGSVSKGAMMIMVVLIPALSRVKKNEAPEVLGAS